MITFVANFTTTASSTITINKVVGGVETLAETGSMTEGTETGVYLYDFSGNVTSDYIAYMKQGTNLVVGKYNGILSSILQKPTGGGGGGTNQKITKEQLKEITEDMTKLMKESLNGLEIELSDDLGLKEIQTAIDEIKRAGIESMKQINDKVELSKPEKQDNAELVKSITDMFDEVKNSQKEKDELIENSMKSILESVEGGIHKNEKRFVGLLKSMKVINDKRKAESVLFSKLIGAFRKEIK